MLSDGVRWDVLLTILRNLWENTFFWHCYFSTQNWWGKTLSLDSAEDLNRVAQIHLTWPEVLTLGTVLLSMQWRVKTDHSRPRWDHRWAETPSEDIWLLSHLQRISSFPIQVPKCWWDGSTPLYFKVKHTYELLPCFPNLSSAFFTHLWSCSLLQNCICTSPYTLDFYPQRSHTNWSLSFILLDCSAQAWWHSANITPMSMPMSRGNFPIGQSSLSWVPFLPSCPARAFASPSSCTVIYPLSSQILSECNINFCLPLPWKALRQLFAYQSPTKVDLNLIPFNIGSQVWAKAMPWKLAVTVNS